MIRLGVIGYGARMRGILDIIERLGADAQVAAITDVRNDEIREEIRQSGRDPSAIRFHTDADEMLEEGG
ncbi:MAG: gfo/Idh/MocA family oxidoreductase, partial [Armatimonadota bacterium]